MCINTVICKLTLKAQTKCRVVHNIAMTHHSSLAINYRQILTLIKVSAVRRSVEDKSFSLEIENTHRHIDNASYIHPEPCTDTIKISD